MDAMDVSFIQTVGVIIVIGLTVFGMWGVFEKAGQPGWYSLIPLYNLIVLCRICGLPGWVVIIIFLPVLNAGFIVGVGWRLGKVFGKGLGFTIGLIILGFVLLPVLALDDSKYLGPKAV